MIKIVNLMNIEYILHCIGNFCFFSKSYSGKFLKNYEFLKPVNYFLKNNNS